MFYLFFAAASYHFYPVLIIYYVFRLRVVLITDNQNHCSNMATQAFRNVQLLNRILGIGIRTLHATVRPASTSTHSRIIQGTNGEKIILSPISDTSYPDTLLHEFVWNNSESYSNLIALVISMI